jgi:hypothetical protein
MLRIIHWTVASLMVLLGLLHSFMAFYCKELNEDTLWFLGSGIAIILAGLFNILLLWQNTRPTILFTLGVNILMTGLFLIATQVLYGNQVYIGIGLFGIAAVLVLLELKRSAVQK